MKENAEMNKLIQKASSYAMQGDFGTSLGFILQAYKLSVADSGEEALDTLACAALLGRTYAALGRSEDALKYFEVAYNGLCHTTGENSQKSEHALKELNDYRAHVTKSSI